MLALVSASQSGNVTLLDIRELYSADREFLYSMSGRLEVPGFLATKTRVGKPQDGIPLTNITW